MGKEGYYDLFAKLCCPINEDSESIVEAVKEWIAFNPDGTKEECSRDTGIPLSVFEDFWSLLVAICDIPSDELNDLNLLKSWIQHNPDATRYECSHTLHLQSKFVAEHWEECGGSVPKTQVAKNKDAALMWIEEHPDGTIYECCKATGIRKTDLEKIWPADMKRDSYFDHTDRKCVERVSQWLADNPNGRVAECAMALNIPRMRIEKAWFEAGGKEENIRNKTDIESEKRRQAVIDWLNSGKEGGIMQCVRDTGLSKRTVSRLWKECGGSAQNMHEKRTAEIKVAVKAWLEDNRLGTIKQCSRDTGIAPNIIKRYWSSLGGTTPEARIVARISAYIEEHPDGTATECAKFTGVTLPVVRRLFEKCKDPEYCKEIMGRTIGNDETKAKVRKWIDEHPDGTLQECTDAIGLSRATVEQYWGIVGGHDVTRRRKDKEKDNAANQEAAAFQKLSDWLKNNPEGTREEARMATGLSRRIVQRNWYEAGGEDQDVIAKKKREKAVLEWFKVNPKGTYEECSKTTGISPSVVGKIVRQNGLSNKQFEENMNKLKTWVKANPIGSKLFCKRATGLPQTFIYAHWEEVGGFKGGKAERMYQEALPILEEWWKNHPGDTVDRCHNETGIGTSRIKQYLKRSGIRDDNE